MADICRKCDGYGVIGGELFSDGLYLCSNEAGARMAGDYVNGPPETCEACNGLGVVCDCGAVLESIDDDCCIDCLEEE